jgi:vitamin B12 transporter
LIEVRGFFLPKNGGGEMGNRLILGFGLLMLMFLAGTAFGKAAGAAEAPLALDTIEVTAEKISEYIKNHPQEVSVVERKEIVNRNLLNVEEVLKTMPGVEVHQSSGTASRVSIRGSGKSGGVLILLNGRPLNTNQYGGVDLNTIPIEIIESVTVFKPPVPVWLGPGASEGAINIITRDLTKSPKGMKSSSTSIMAAGGSFGLAQGSASQLLSLGGGKLLMTGSGLHRDGKRINSDKNEGNFSGYWNREDTQGKRFEINGRYYLSGFGSPGPLDNLTPNARQRYEKGSLDARMAGLMGDTGRYSLNPYLDRVWLQDRAQSGFIASLDDLKAGLKSESTWSDPAGLGDMRIGGILEQDTFDHTLAGQHQRTLMDLSGQVDRRFGSLSGTMGLRGNYTNDFQFNPGFSGGLGYAVTDKVLMRAKAGYTVNVPTFSHLYQTSHGSIDQVRGNPNLKEEKIWSYNLGLEVQFGKEQSFQVSLFRSDTRDLISFDRGADKIYRPVNVDRAWRQGMEMTCKYQWEKDLTVMLNGILQDSRNDVTGKELPYTPRTTMKMSGQYTLVPFKTKLEAALRYEGSRTSEAEALESQRLDDYFVVDLKIIQPFQIRGDHWEWFVKVDNVFNRSFQSHYGYPDDGIRFVSGFQWRF